MLHTACTVDMVYVVYTVNMVYTVDMVYTAQVHNVLFLQFEFILTEQAEKYLKTYARYTI